MLASFMTMTLELMTVTFFRPRSISYVAGTVRSYPSDLSKGLTCLQFVTARTLPVLRPTACRHFSLWNSSANTVKHTPTPLDGEKASAVVQSTQPAGDVAPVPLNSAVSSHLPEGNLAQTSLDTTSTLQQAASAPVDPSIALQNSAMVDAVTHAAPIQLGDFHSLGLVDFWPSGIANQLLEVFHVATGLPWFYTIILFVAGVRIAVIPASIGSLRQSARLVQINSHVTRVRSETSNATDPFSKQYHALQMKRLMAGAGVNNSLIGVNMATTLFAQLGVWFGISRLCKLPLDQLTSSGVAFLPDLIAPDLYCSMLATLCIQVAITVGAIMRCLHPVLTNMLSIVHEAGCIQPAAWSCSQRHARPLSHPRDLHTLETICRMSDYFISGRASRTLADQWTIGIDAHHHCRLHPANSSVASPPLASGPTVLPNPCAEGSPAHPGAASS